MTETRTKVISAAIVLAPMFLIVLENETGVALVYSCFILVMYREGLSGNILLLGVAMGVLFLLALLINKFILIGVLAFLSFLLFLVVRKTTQNILVVVLIFIMSSGVVYSVQYAFDKLEPHQKKRINVFLGKESDKKKAGYNVNQSLIAIGSGGILGKGFLQGTQTKYDFVPEQSTDFIFCTVGEEWGFVGATVVVFLFLALLLRIIQVAERQRSDLWLWRCLHYLFSPARKCWHDHWPHAGHRYSSTLIQLWGLIAVGVYHTLVHPDQTRLLQT